MDVCYIWAILNLEMFAKNRKVVFEHVLHVPCGCIQVDLAAEVSAITC